MSSERDKDTNDSDERSKNSEDRLSVASDLKKERKNSKKLETVQSNLNSRIDSLIDTRNKIEKKKEIVLTTYLGQCEGESSESKHSSAFKTFQTKNNRYKLELEKVDKKLKRLESEKAKIEVSGVTPIDYLQNVSLQKLSDGAQNFRNKLQDLITTKEEPFIKEEIPNTPNDGKSIHNGQNKDLSLERLRNRIQALFGSTENSSDSEIAGKNSIGRGVHFEKDNSLERDRKSPSDVINNSNVTKTAMFNTFALVADMVDSMNNRLKPLEEKFDAEIMNDRDLMIEKRMDEYEQRIQMEMKNAISENYRLADMINEINTMVEGYDKRLTKIENLLASVIVKGNNQETSPGQMVLTKLANVVVQIISIVVMLVSSFADVIIDLNKNLKLAMMITFLGYLLFRMLYPIFAIFK